MYMIKQKSENKQRQNLMQEISAQKQTSKVHFYRMNEDW